MSKKSKAKKELYMNLMEAISTQSKSIKADEDEIAKINAEIASTAADKTDILDQLTSKRSQLETSISRKSIDLARNLTALNSLEAGKTEDKRNVSAVLSGVLPAVIGSASTLAATYAFIKIEHSDCITGVTAKEIVKIVISGLGRNRRQ